MIAVMAKSRKNPKSKRSQGEDRHTQPRIAFHYPDDLAKALEDYLASNRPSPSKSEVLRLALEEFLSKRGKWPRP